MAYRPCKRAHKLWQALQKGCGKPCRRAKRFPSEDGEQDVDEFSSINSGKPFPELPEIPPDKSHETEEPLPECMICYGDDWTTKRVEGGWIELVDSVRLCHACAIHST